MEGEAATLVISFLTESHSLLSGFAVALKVVFARLLASSGLRYQLVLIVALQGKRVAFLRLDERGCGQALQRKFPVRHHRPVICVVRSLSMKRDSWLPRIGADRKSVV